MAKPPDSSPRKAIPRRATEPSARDQFLIDHPLQDPGWAEVALFFFSLVGGAAGLVTGVIAAILWGPFWTPIVTGLLGVIVGPVSLLAFLNVANRIVADRTFSPRIWGAIQYTVMGSSVVVTVVVALYVARLLH